MADNLTATDTIEPLPSALYRMNCIYRALLEQEQLLVEATDRPGLLNSICQRLITTGFFDIVGIGSPDADGLVRYHHAAGKQAAELIHTFSTSVKLGAGTLSGEAMSTGKMQVSNHYLNDPRTSAFQAKARKMNIRAWAAIPIVVDKTTWGVLGIISHREDFFDDDMLQLLSTSAMLIGRALERRNIFERLEDRKIALERLNSLYHAMLEESKFILSARDESELLRGTCETLVAKGAFLLVGIGYPDETGTLRYHYGAGLTRDEIMRGFAFSVSDGTATLSSLAWQTGKLQYSNDYPHEPHAAAFNSQPAARHIQSLATAPIFRGGTIWGLLSVVSSQKDFFDPDMLNLLTSCAQMLGRALDSMDMKCRLERLGSLYKSLSIQGEIILEAPDENTLLTQTVDQLARGGLFIAVTVARPNAKGLFDFIATAGTGSDQIEKHRVSVLGGEGKSLVAQAWRENKLCWSDDYQADSAFANNHTVITMIGGKSAAAVPIVRQGHIWGVMGLISIHQNLFDQEMRNLIARVAQLLGHALDEIDLRTRLDDELTQQAWLASHDTLTGLPNRATLDEYIEKAMVRAQRHKTLLAVAMMDVNEFKLINDTYGHAVGDAFLRALAGRIKNALRKTDSALRLGGDEFVILLEDLRHHEDAKSYFTRLAAILDEPFALPGNRRINVSTSIGYCLFPNDSADSSALLRQADSALYRLKACKTGRTRWQASSEP
ncbi:MAG: GAF domain-containing protein [Phycisphaerae bacterium]